MKASQRPEYLASVTRDVEEFRSCFERFLEHFVLNESFARGVAPAAFRREEATDEQVATSSRAVGVAAGRASAATKLTNSYIVVQGVGPVDPIAVWRSVVDPKPVLEPAHILSACDQMIGRLQEMTRKAEAEAPPAIGPEALHPLIWGAAARLWKDGHPRQAVAAAADALVQQVKSRTGRTDVADTHLWQETFSTRDPEPGRPRLRWPGDPHDRAVKTMNDGLRQLAPGAQLTIRNPAVHNSDDMTEQEAYERLATLSLLARWTDRCGLESDGSNLQS
jgi:hypothetical protein